MSDFEKPCYTRIRNRTIAISDSLWNRIQIAKKDTISTSSFIRRAIEKELEVWENGRNTRMDENIRGIEELHQRDK